MLFEPASARSYKIGAVGNNWLVAWLVGNAVFSETALRIFLIKWQSQIFEKNSWFGNIREKVSKLAQN